MTEILGTVLTSGAAADSSFLTRAVKWIRKWADEPSLKTKYTDSELIGFIEQQWDIILGELNRLSTSPIVARANITLSSTQQFYAMPPTCATILGISEFNTSHEINSSLQPRGRFNPLGPGVTFEGNILRLQPSWVGDATVYQVDYLPTGDVRLHQGTAGTITQDATNHLSTVELAATPTVGSLDTRDNAYAGSVLRILGATTNNYVQERVISSYDRTTRIATVKPEFSPTLATDTAVIYEIAPLLFQAQDPVVAMAVVRDILAIEGDSRLKSVSEAYNIRMRALRLNVSSLNAINGQKFENDTMHNRRFVEW
jgi:hypothetical protein